LFDPRPAGARRYGVRSFAMLSRIAAAFEAFGFCLR
jgi:hypothetical protein